MMRGGGRGGGKRRGALRGRQLLLLRRRHAGGTNVVSGGPVVMDPFATDGSSSIGAAVIDVGALGSVATIGSSSLVVTLKKIGVVLAATTGQGNVAAVLIDLESLTAITQGASNVGAQLKKIGVLAAASAGVAAAQATLAAIRLLAVTSTAGTGNAGASIGGAHISLEAATSGSSEMNVAFESTGGSLPIVAGYARRTRPRRPDWTMVKGSIRPIKAATSGSSCVTALLTLVPPDTFDEELAFVLLEAAA